MINLTEVLYQYKNLDKCHSIPETKFLFIELRNTEESTTPLNIYEIIT